VVASAQPARQAAPKAAWLAQNQTQLLSLETLVSRATGSGRAHASGRGTGQPANSPTSPKGELSYVGQGSQLWDDLDSLDQQVRSGIHLQDLAVGSAFTVTTGLTVGYVLWMIRGGLLVSSLVAQMPAWKLVDPLVVLSGLDEDWSDSQSEEDEETLESIVESMEDTPEPVVATQS
jgi:hypothetical protein